MLWYIFDIWTKISKVLQLYLLKFLLNAFFFIVTASCLPRGNMATEHVKLNMVNWTWPILSWKREGNGVHMCYGCIRVHRALEKHPRKIYLLKFLLNAFFYSFIPFIQCKLLMQCKSYAWQNQSFSFFQRNVEYSVSNLEGWRWQIR